MKNTRGLITERGIDKTSISPDQIAVSNHEVIDRTRSLLEDNPAGYVPGLGFIPKEGQTPISVPLMQADVTKVVEEESYKLRLDALEILYHPENDTITIKGNKKTGDMEDSQIRLAVGQALMILSTPEAHKGGAEIYGTLQGTGENNQIIIQNASRLIKSSAE